MLDLGSGGGIDVLLSAKRVGPTGKAYGLDMTDEMLALARENQAKAGVPNVEFLKGEIEHIPLPDNSVDVIISNCVINLSGDKPRVLREAFRVLKPGGRFAVSDVVVRGEVPADIRKSMELWIGCVAGALEEAEYRQLLAGAGFGDIDLEPTRVYKTDDARAFLAEAGLDRPGLAESSTGVHQRFVRATKPGEARPAAAGRPAALVPHDDSLRLHAQRRALADAAAFCRAYGRGACRRSRPAPRPRRRPPGGGGSDAGEGHRPGRRPAPPHRELAGQADVLVTMGCGEACPVVPGVRRRLAARRSRPAARARARHSRRHRGPRPRLLASSASAPRAADRTDEGPGDRLALSSSWLSQPLAPSPSPGR